MAAQTQDKFQKKGASTVTTLSAPGKAIGAGSITVGSTTNYPTDTGITIAIRVVDTNGDLVAGTYTEWNAVVASGTSFTIDTTPAYGSDQIYAAGSTTQVFIPLSSYSHNKMIDALLTEHDQDGTHGVVTGTSFTASGTVQGATVISTGDIQHRSVSLETIRSEMEFDYVASGCVWSGDAYASTRNASMTSGVIYINGRRLTASAVSARSFTASKDTYIDASDNGDGTVLLTYNEVANNAASPALAANNVRVGIIVTGATNIAAAGSVNQGQFDRVLPIVSGVAYTFTDSIGNIICPRDPNRRVIGYRQITANFVSTTSLLHQNVTGLLAPVIVPSSRKVKAHFKPGSGVSSAGAVGSSIGTGIYRGGIAGTGISLTAMLTTSGSNVTQVGDAHGVDEPSSSSQSYGATTYGSGTAATSVVATATNPAYIIVELE